MAWKKCHERTGCLDCSECLDQYNIVYLLQLIAKSFFVISVLLCSNQRHGRKTGLKMNYVHLNLLNVNPLSPLCSRDQIALNIYTHIYIV